MSRSPASSMTRGMVEAAGNVVEIPTQGPTGVAAAGVAAAAPGAAAGATPTIRSGPGAAPTSCRRDGRRRRPRGWIERRPDPRPRRRRPGARARWARLPRRWLRPRPPARRGGLRPAHRRQLAPTRSTAVPAATPTTPGGERSRQGSQRGSARRCAAAPARTASAPTPTTGCAIASGSRGLGRG